MATLTTSSFRAPPGLHGLIHEAARAIRVPGVADALRELLARHAAHGEQPPGLSPDPNAELAAIRRRIESIEASLPQRIADALQRHPRQPSGAMAASGCTHATPTMAPMDQMTRSGSVQRLVLGARPKFWSVSEQEQVKVATGRIEE